MRVWSIKSVYCFHHRHLIMGYFTLEYGFFLLQLFGKCKSHDHIVILFLFCRQKFAYLPQKKKMCVFFLFCSFPSLTLWEYLPSISLGLSWKHASISCSRVLRSFIFVTNQIFLKHKHTHTHTNEYQNANIMIVCVKSTQNLTYI